MKEINKVKVSYNGKVVGSIIRYQRYLTAFAYDPEWLSNGFSISPFSLPLREEPFIAKQEPFDGLFGVFADSLPDGWGRLLLDRLLLKNKINPHSVGNLERLAIVGASGMGALSYEPEYNISEKSGFADLDKLAEECSLILSSEYNDNIDELFSLGGSSGGARPKILTEVDGEDWIIKFLASMDKPDIGLQEYKYSLCARKCGISMSETHLFPSARCEGYFGTKRFDRVKTSEGEKRIHMVSVSALLETSHRIPNLDYIILGKLTLTLTKDYQELEKLFRLMCFNVFAHNRDDHSKNFSFIYSDDEKKWLLSPAYDLTYSYSIGGEHATTVAGNGKNPGMKDILEVAKNLGMN
ncbi:type II toxin-antitoxin system HipA family toxin, partial [Phascolarctobacterium succinatutens]